MASRPSSNVHNYGHDSTKNEIRFSNVDLKADEDGNIENNLKFTLDNVVDGSIFAYRLPEKRSIISKDHQSPDTLLHSKDAPPPLSSIHNYLPDQSYFSFDGVEVESTISMSCKHEDSSLFGSFHSLNGSCYVMKDDQSGGDKNHDNVGLESTSHISEHNATHRHCCCLPSCLQDAPLWIRSIAFTSIFLFIASFILVLSTVAIKLSNRGNSAMVTPSTKTIPDYPPPSRSPSSSLDHNGNVGIVARTKTTRPSTKHILSSLAPTKTFAQRQKTTLPYSLKGITMQPSSSQPHSFWVISGQQNKMTDMATILKSLPSNKSTMALFHLGNWIDPNNTTCASEVYLQVTRKYESSPVPVIFLPGENESNNCQNPEIAWGNWQNYLLNYSQTYQTSSHSTLRMDRQWSHTENFSFVHFGVLYIGVHLVGGNVTNQTFWTLRLGHDLSWIDDNVNRFKNSVSIIVLLGNSGPSTSNTNNDLFFTGLRTLVVKYNSEVMDTQSGRVRALPFVYIHDGSSTWAVTQKFMGVNRFIRVNVEGNKWPPMRVLLNPFNNTIIFDQNNWINGS